MCPRWPPPSPRRARIFLAEKGVPHDTIAVDLRTGEQLGDAYRQISDLKLKELLDRRYERLQGYGRFTDTRAATK